MTTANTRNSIEEVPTINSCLPLRGLSVRPVAYDVLGRVVRTQRGPLLARAPARVGLPSAHGRAGESWETLSYAVLWLCGLSGIVLSFR